MKRLVISALSTVVFATLVAPAMAGGSVAFKKSLNTNVVATSVVSDITPFNLISGAYQGRFVRQGIPSGAIFLSRIRSNRIDAEDLVKAAIASNRLSEDTLQNEEYLDYVDSLLESLDRL